MSPVHLVCDSTADFEPDDAARLGLTVVPLRVIFGEDQLLDGVELSTADFYRRIRTDPHHPRTSQPTPAEFEAVFRRLGADGGAIVCTTISSDLSGTYASAMQARAALPELDIRVIDTRNVGPAHTATVNVAIRVRDRGGDANAVVGAVERVKASLRLVFTLENLEFLRRGGRIGGARAFLGTVLSIKPILEVVNGRVEAVDRVRTYAKALGRLVEEVARSAREWGPTTVIVGHAAAPEQAQATAGRVAAVTGEPPQIVQVGAVLGCHAGPGGFGIGFHPRALAEL